MPTTATLPVVPAVTEESGQICPAARSFDAEAEAAIERSLARLRNRTTVYGTARPTRYSASR